MKYEELAQRTGIPEEQAKLFEKYFWLGIRYYITHPLESKGRIQLKDFVFRLNEGKMYLIEQSGMPNHSDKEREFIKTLRQYFYANRKPRKRKNNESIIEHQRNDD